jgi:hypothetical protein
MSVGDFVFEQFEPPQEPPVVAVVQNSDLGTSSHSESESQDPESSSDSGSDSIAPPLPKKTKHMFKGTAEYMAAHEGEVREGVLL